MCDIGFFKYTLIENREIEYLRYFFEEENSVWKVYSLILDVSCDPFGKCSIEILYSTRLDHILYLILENNEINHLGYFFEEEKSV